MTKIAFMFKDTKKKIEVDLSKNIALYGINGRGKTRVLQAISTLHDLVKKNNHKDIIDLLQSLNLDDLEINGASYKSLFLNIDELRISEETEVLKYIRKNADAFLYLQDRITIVNNQFAKFLASIDMHRVKDIQRLLIIILKEEQKLKQTGLIFRDISDLLSDVEYIAERIKRLSRNSEYTSTNNIDSFDRLSYDILDVQSYLRNNMSNIIFENRDMSNSNALTRNKKQILKSIQRNKVHYFSIELENNVRVFDIIKEHYSNINKELLNNVWSHANEISLDLVYDTLKKVSFFNTIINKYENIDLSIDTNGSCIFTKNGDSLQFNQFSSGEKRLITLFLTLIFVRANIFLIDEPELSLSLNYQSKIVKDMLDTVNSNTIILATHAPFIFNDFTSLDRSTKVEV